LRHPQPTKHEIFFNHKGHNIFHKGHNIFHKGHKKAFSLQQLLITTLFTCFIFYRFKRCKAILNIKANEATKKSVNFA